MMNGLQKPSRRQAGASQMGAVSVAFALGRVMVGLGLLFGNGAASYIFRLLGRVSCRRNQPLFL